MPRVSYTFHISPLLRHPLCALFASLLPNHKRRTRQRRRSKSHWICVLIKLRVCLMRIIDIDGMFRSNWFLLHSCFRWKLLQIVLWNWFSDTEKGTPERGPKDRRLMWERWERGEKQGSDRSLFKEFDRCTNLGWFLISFPLSWAAQQHLDA